MNTEIKQTRSEEWDRGTKKKNMVTLDVDKRKFVNDQNQYWNGYLHNKIAYLFVYWRLASGQPKQSINHRFIYQISFRRSQIPDEKFNKADLSLPHQPVTA